MTEVPANPLGTGPSAGWLATDPDGAVDDDADEGGTAGPVPDEAAGDADPAATADAAE